MGRILIVDESDIEDADGLSNPHPIYQWLADDTDISGATRSFYTLVSADEGKAIRVRVTFSDDLGNRETLTSDATEAVAAKPNSPATGLPTISGTAQVGVTLTAVTTRIDDADGVDEATFTYQWIADDTDISGAISDTYTLVSDDEGKAIKVRVSFTDDLGYRETLTSDPTAAAKPNSPATGKPTISGMLQVGDTLTADTSGISDADGLDNVTFTYQWIADDGNGDADISGATGSTYTLVSDDEGKTIKVRVSFTDNADNEESLTSDATAAVGPKPNSPATGKPTISGMLQVGDTLTADTSGISDADGLDNVTFTYQWIADDGNGDADISGATGSTYTLVSDDEGKTIKVRVSFTDNADNEESLTSDATAAVGPKPNSPATGKPSISGTLRVGEKLTAVTTGIEDADGIDEETYTYQWLADDVEIAGATEATYTLVSADEGKTVKVRVSFTDNADNDETLTSEATAVVEPKPNSPATGKPTISGTLRVGEKLTAVTTGIEDADGIDEETYTYQWLADDVEIAGATEATYTLVSADDGKAIMVRVNFTDDGGNPETLTSEPTAAVAAAPILLTAWFEEAPESHNGTDAFTFRIAFSEDIGISYATFRDHSLEVTDGEVTRAKRHNGRNDLWEVTVQPSSDADVVVLLPETNNCNDLGAVCTGTGNMLSARLELTVAGSQGSGQNSPATGLPTIDGTARVGDTLTAGTSAIADEDGLDNVPFSYQWLADDVEIAGATSDTYTPVSADEGKTIKVRVSFTDSANNTETLTSDATEAVVAAPILLTAWFEEAPESHNGTDAFTFRIAFSEDIGISYATFRDDSLEVTDGEVTRARRHNGRNDLWEVTVQPDSDADVVIVVEADRACDLEGAICARDGSGRRLSNRLELTVARQNTPATGLPTISGTLRVGETLTAVTTGIEDADGIDESTYTYQWLADDADISGATDSTYTLVSADQGKTIKVRVSFTDGGGNAESLTTPGRRRRWKLPQPVQNSPATGLPTIGGKAPGGRDAGGGHHRHRGRRRH